MNSLLGKYKPAIILTLALTVFLASCISLPTTTSTPGWVVTTLAGSRIWGAGYQDATGTAAQFRYPSSVAVDSSGNLYVADTGNHCIRKITSAGVVTTLVGSGTRGHKDATGTEAQFWIPYGVAVDSSGNLYVADKDNHRIRKITSAGDVTTFAGSTRGHHDATGTEAQFWIPYGVAVDSSGNLYVADTRNHSIRKITSEGVVTTLAGSGTEGYKEGAGSGDYQDATGTAAEFDYPTGVAVDSSGNVYVADNGNHRIRKITSAGKVTTFAGSGTVGHHDATGTEAQFHYPTGVAVDSSGNVYVADSGNDRIRKITSGGVVTTFAGSTEGHQEGAGTAAQFNRPSGVAVDSSGNLYVADTGNHRIRKITSAGVVTTLAGSTAGHQEGAGTAAQFRYPSDVAVDSSGNLYVADHSNNRIRKITSAGKVSTLAGSATRGKEDGAGTAAQFNFPSSVAVDSSGNVYVADYVNNRIRKIEYK